MFTEILPIPKNSEAPCNRRSVKLTSLEAYVFYSSSKGLFGIQHFLACQMPVFPPQTVVPSFNSYSTTRLTSEVGVEKWSHST